MNNYMKTPNTFNQIRANAEAGANGIYGRTIIPQNNTNLENSQRYLYDKLKNNITYSTTGFAREEKNIGAINLERW